MSNDAKVMGAIKNFLLKMKALDAAIPEELAQDALEMTEEVKDALCEEGLTEDEDKAEKETKAGDEKEEVKEEIDIDKKVEDAMGRVLRKYGLIKDASMEAIEKIEEETEDSDEEDVTVDPEKMNDSAVKELIRTVKPAIASVKDSKTRKILSDNFAKAIKMNTSNQYGDMMTILNANAKEKAKDAKAKDAASNADFGMEIAKKFNPHYKEEN